MSIWLAYAMLAYVGACVYYIVMTRNIGTPFKDSLTEAQIQIKNASTLVRKSIFMQGIGVTIIALFLLRPFKKCD